MALEPSLWRTLPEELLHLVFAHRPVVRIGELRVLSKEWKRNVDCKDSEFNYVLDETTNLNMFALLPLLSGQYGNIYDVQANKWHVYEIDPILKMFDEHLGNVDGGLVCFISKWISSYNKPRFCYVMNPLTKQKRQLPSLLCMEAKKSNNYQTMTRMLKLTVDKKTKEYKVFVLSSIESGGGGFFAQVYDSRIKEWTVVEATQGHIIGWDSINPYTFSTPLCMFNFADGTLHYFNGTDFALELKVEPSCCVLLEDHLFVLHKEVPLGLVDLLEDGASVLPKYCISEFHFSQDTTTWVKLGVHSCGPCKVRSYDTVYSNLELFGCNGFLLVYTNNDYFRSSWLYNLSTCEWRTLPTLPEPNFFRMMCTTSWSAIA